MPAELVVNGEGVVVTATLLYLMVMAWLAPKPLPVTVTVAPEGPLVGLRVILAETVKVAVA